MYTQLREEAEGETLPFGNAQGVSSPELCRLSSGSGAESDGGSGEEGGRSTEKQESCYGKRVTGRQMQPTSANGCEKQKPAVHNSPGWHRIMYVLCLNTQASTCVCTTHQVHACSCACIN